MSPKDGDKFPNGLRIHSALTAEQVGIVHDVRGAMRLIRERVSNGAALEMILEALRDCAREGVTDFWVA